MTFNNQQEPYLLSISKLYFPKYPRTKILFITNKSNVQYHEHSNSKSWFSMKKVYPLKLCSVLLHTWNLVAWILKVTTILKVKKMFFIGDKMFFPSVHLLEGVRWIEVCYWEKYIRRYFQTRLSVHLTEGVRWIGGLLNRGFTVIIFDYWLFTWL